VARALLAALLALACSTLPAAPDARPEAGPRLVSAPAASDLEVPPLPDGAVRLVPQPLTVEDHWLLDLYTRLHARDYTSHRVEFPGADGEPAVAHFLVPPGPGPHPAALVFPILGGSYVVSEMVAKVLVGRGYAALHLERRRLFPRDEDRADPDPAAPAERMRLSVLDARRLLDWLETRPEIDPSRIGATGVSIGGILAATLMGVDDRVRAGVFIMAGGGLPELLHDSTEKPVRRFRDAVLSAGLAEDRAGFLRLTRPFTEPLDPLTRAHRIDPGRVVLVSGRFDRVVPPERTRALWEGLGRPRWHRFPAGHYQIVPFFWWAVHRGADLFDEVLVADAPPGLRAER
jgi:dipeptidyl aminopeptidase/acylaminoacyl peptidase